MNHLLCLGFGYSARALAARLPPHDWRITGTSTTEAGCARIRDAGHASALFDGQSPSAALAAALATTTHLLVSAAPGDQGDPLLSQHREDLQRATQLQWIGYLSTVGVYGDHGGGWVDETTPVAPTSERSRRRVLAEQAWQALAGPRLPIVGIFRLSGIYGPGSSAVDNLRAGTARRIVKFGQVFNRIHVADIALVVNGAMTRQQVAGVYNVTDDEPAPPQDVIAYAASLLGLPVPPDLPFETTELTPMARSFYSENKRVRNDRIKADFGIALQYPSYREGMAAIAAGTGRNTKDGG
jgi:nucleoside-diphosphate-sugar epimerase